MLEKNSSKFTEKRELILAHIKKDNWTIYTLASELGVKANEIYGLLDQHTRIMFVRQGKLLPKHATEGLYNVEEPKPKKHKRVNPRSLFEQLLGQKPSR